MSHATPRPIDIFPRSAQAGLGARLARPFVRRWRALRLRMAQAATRRATEALDDRLRDDIGLPPRGPSVAKVSVLSEDWLR